MFFFSLKNFYFKLKFFFSLFNKFKKGKAHFLKRDFYYGSSSYLKFYIHNSMYKLYRYFNLKIFLVSKKLKNLKKNIKIDMKNKFKNFFFVKDFINFIHMLKFNKKSNSFLGFNYINSNDTVFVVSKILKNLLKKLNFDKIYKKFLKGFYLVHFSKIITNITYKRVFVLYKKLKKFLCNY